MSLLREAELVQQRIDAEKETVPALKEQVHSYNATQASIGSVRHLQRRRFHLRQRAEEVEKQIACIESGEAERVAAEKLEAYQRAEQNLQKVQRSETLRIGTVEVQSGQHNSLINEFRTEMGLDVPQVQVTDKDQCPMCDNSLVLVQLRALLTCGVCGYATPHVDSTSCNMAYNDDMDFTSFHYKRQNHFEEWLKQLQAKESTVVGNDILTEVMRVLQDRKISPERVTHKLVREALKTLKYRNCYDYCSQITSKITGKPPPRLTPEIEEKCRVMFVAMQPYFEKHANGRTNFLSYPYCLYKFFQLLGLDEHLCCFNLLKGKDKLARMDEIFKKISSELGWEWVPS